MADEIDSRVQEETRLAKPFDFPGALVEDAITGADTANIVDHRLHRRRPEFGRDRRVVNARDGVRRGVGAHAA